MKRAPNSVEIWFGKEFDDALLFPHWFGVLEVQSKSGATPPANVVPRGGQAEALPPTCSLRRTGR